VFPLGIITALKSEAACLRNILDDDNVLKLNSGMGPDAATATAQDAVARGCMALVSFGYAGALSPKLRSGDILVGRSVSNGKERHEIDTQLAMHLEKTLAESGLTNIESGDFLSTPRVIESVLDKKQYAASGKWNAVDMESYSIAAAARKYDLPFIIVRSILDTADTELPAAINTMTDLYGDIKPLSVLGAMLRTPLIVPKLIRLAGSRRQADRSLRGVAPVLVGALASR